MDLCLDFFGNHVWICVRIFFVTHLWICVRMLFGNHMCICKKDYFGNHGSVFSSPPGSCRAGWVCWQWQLFQPKRRYRFNLSISSSPSYIDVKVDVDTDMIFVTCITCSACVKLSASGKILHVESAF